MFLIVGLGNPGTEYAATRHNIGFDMVTYLSDKYGIALRSKEGKAIVGKGVIEGQKGMPVGQVRIRPKGSAGGHNGIKSIIAHLGTQEFPRIKIGVGAKPENGDLVKHVLGRFSKEDDAKIRDVFALAEEGLLAILQEDVKTAMNAVNGKKVGE